MSKEARGSEKLWDRIFEEDPTHAKLGEAVAAARESYRVLRWWKYGQPQIDLIKATFDVPTAQSGALIQDILQSSGSRANISLDAFPYGLPQIERVQVNVTFEKTV